MLCAGCHTRGQSEANWPVVSQITVTCEHQGTLTRQFYTSEAKMRQILNCLRSLGQKSSPPIDPDTISARTYSITLTHTDGSQRIYQTKADRYIRICRDPWQQADPEKVSELHLLLQGLPGDDPALGQRQDIPKHYSYTPSGALEGVIFSTEQF